MCIRDRGAAGLEEEEETKSQGVREAQLITEGAEERKSEGGEGEARPVREGDEGEGRLRGASSVGTERESHESVESIESAEMDPAMRLARARIEQWRRERDQSRREREEGCLLYTSPSPRDGLLSRMPSSA
eukprot:TRINITY_DN11340_c0_g1_i1.p2 TRINITY_DN11340_c0_g1~~TRINITY_DN11340_c0_g1_i1.p2  ORF type:complete len:131 (+),score=32.28 TRINITY_DN11340_c0_g1_i1:62-454(+)